jgi:hypothetical protein
MTIKQYVVKPFNAVGEVCEQSNVIASGYIMFEEVEIVNSLHLFVWYIYKNFEHLYICCYLLKNKKQQ